jgi:tetratricopeptide (TPR) repeat protein
MRPSNFKYLFLILFLLGGQLGLCCINEYRTLLNGKLEFTAADNAAPFGRFSQENKAYLLQQLHKADSIYKATGKIEDYSDYGAMLVYNGQYLQAKALFIEIESKKPGLYATASNLGTTYELLGQNDSALFWISKAIKINPNSHEGSEWIHLKILEAKIKSNGDDKYFLTHNLLSLDFGDSEKPVNKKNIDLLQLRSQLYHQLNERMSFIKPQDQIVGQLLFDLGNVNAMTMDVKSGLQVYEVAKKYGFNSDLLTKRENHFKSLQRKADFKNNKEVWANKNPSTAFFILIALFISFVAGLIYLVKRIRKNKQNSV